MMRRFSRKRRSRTEGPRRSIDAAHWFAKILEARVVEAKSLAPVEQSEVQGTVAAIGRGERADGSEMLVAFSPRSATEALLGGLAAAQQAAAESSFAVLSINCRRFVRTRRTRTSSTTTFAWRKACQRTVLLR